MSWSHAILPCTEDEEMPEIQEAQIVHYRGTIYGMAPPQSKVTAQGQISVPAEIRKKLGIGPGSVLEWEQEGDKVVVRKAPKFSSIDIHNAIFKKPPQPHTIEEMDEAIARYIRKKYARR
jgi:AbrB family looped-hinge helix DNA binding protein